MIKALKRKACYLLIGFFSITQFTFSQDQKLADSLTRIYQQGELEDTAKMELLLQLSFNEMRDLKLGLRYAEDLISLSTQKGNNLYVFRGYSAKGFKKRLLGDMDEALDAYFKSVNAASKIHYTKGEGNSYTAIADIYSITQNKSNAMLYYNKAISTLRQAGDSILLAAALTNAGGEYLDNKKYDSALLYFGESTIISEKVDYVVGKAYNLGNIGTLYAQTGQNELAKKILMTQSDYWRNQKIIIRSAIILSPCRISILKKEIILMP